MPDVNLTPLDRDLMTRTLIGEAADQPDQGQAGVAHVILNRAQAGRYGGQSPAEVVLAPNQFEPWATRAHALLSIDPTSPEYQRAASIVGGVVSGNIPDPTDGATHFYSPKTQAALGRKPPSWAKGPPVTIGGHQFFAPEGKVTKDEEDLLGKWVPKGVAGNPTAAVASPAVSPATAASGAPEEDLLGSWRPAGASTQPVAPTAPRAALVEGYDPAAGTLNGEKVSSAAQASANAVLGLARGGKDVLDTMAHGLARGTSAGADYLASKGLISPEAARSIAASRDETIAADQAGNKLFAATMSDSPAADFGRIGGNIAATLPLLATGGGAVGAGANALTRASPLAARAAAAIENKLLLRAGAGAVTGAAAGAGGNALLSSASNEPLSDQMARGAALGGALGTALPLAFRAASGTVNAARGFIEPFTQRGQGAIADRVVTRFANGGPTAINDVPYVHGSQPTLAQATANPGLATLERAVRDVNPNPFTGRAASNAEARDMALGSLRGDANSLDDLVANRTANADANISRVFSGAKPVNSAPVLSVIDNILASPSGKRDAVTSSLGNIRAKLADETDPHQLYGVRQAITDMLSPLSHGTASDGRLASKELGKVKDALDSAIEGGAPGYRNYLTQFADESRPIDTQKYLQGLNLTDARGNITLARVDNAMKRIDTEQRAPGPRAAKSIPDDTLEALHSLRADLMREGNSSLGKSIGSNTFQNLATNNLLGRVAGPLSLLEMGVGHNPLMAAAMYGGKKLYSSQNDAILHALSERMLDPALGGNALSRAASPAYGGQNFLTRTGMPVGVIAGNRLISPPPAMDAALNNRNR